MEIKIKEGIIAYKFEDIFIVTYEDGGESYVKFFGDPYDAMEFGCGKLGFKNADGKEFYAGKAPVIINNLPYISLDEEDRIRIQRLLLDASLTCDAVADGGAKDGDGA